MSRSMFLRWLAMPLLLCAGMPVSQAAIGFEVTVAEHLRGCGYIPVSVVARDGTGMPDTAYGGRIALNAGTGGSWILVSGSGTIESPAPDAPFAYTFAPADQGIVHLAYLPSSNNPFTVNVSDGVLAAVSRTVNEPIYQGGAIEHGLWATYFSFTPWAGANNPRPPYPEPPNLASADLIQLESSPSVNEPAQPDNSDRDGFSINWTGTLKVPVTGDYIIHAQSNDGTQVYLDGNLIIDSWRDYQWDGGNHASAPVRLFAGAEYDLKVYFYDRYDDALLNFRIEKIGDPAGSVPVPTDWLNACVSTTPILTTPLAHYKLEEQSWSGNANDVMDEEGGFHGLASDGFSPATSVPALTGSPGTCGYGSVPFDDTLAVRAGLISGVSINNDIGRSGTIAFWYRSSSAWVGGPVRTLIDASENSANGAYFYLALASNGQLVFRMRTNWGTQDLWSWGAYPVSADEWAHITITWDLAAQRAEIHVKDASGNPIGSPVSSGSMGGNLRPLGPLVFGDNASTINTHAWRDNYSWNPTSADGEFDEIRIYQGVLTAQEISALARARHPCGAADHFAISHAGTAVNCEAAPVAITAHDVNDAVFSLYTGTVTLNTSTGHGNWALVAGDGVFANIGNGKAQYTFVPADNGSASFTLRNTFPETLSINISDGTVSEAADEDANLEFKPAGFIVTSDYAGGVIPVQIAGKPSDQDYNKAALKLKAVRTDNNTGACAAIFDGDVTVKVAVDCVNPASCTPDTLNFSSVALPVSNGASPSYSNIQLTFDKTTFDAPFAFAYDGAAELQFLFRYALDASNNISGASNKFVVRPFAIDVQAISNPAATGPAGSKYVSSGTPFKAKLRAVAWQAADDTNKDGVADGHDDTNPANNAKLTDNATVESFALMGATHEEALLSSALVAPSGGNNPTLAGSTSFTSYVKGVSSEQSVRFDEVGIIELAVGLKTSSYMGISAAETAKIRGRSGYVGRFSADHFTTVISNHGCSDTDDFSYSGQPIAKLKLEARNAQNGIVTNYEWDSVSDTGFAKNVTISDPNASSPGSVINGGVSQKDFANGIVDLNDVAFKFSSVRLPYDFIVRATDTDGATSKNKTEGTTNVRAARLVIDDAYSPDFQPARANIRVESYQATSATTQDWELESQDACTSLTLAANLSLDMFDPPVAGVTGTALSLSNGSGAVDFSPAGAGNEGSLRATLLGPAWLKFDWHGSGAENPSAKISYFGIYDTETGFIDRREIY